MDCFICKNRMADAELKVSLTRVVSGGPTGQQRQYKSVPVPVCSSCKTAELAARKRQAQIALVAMFLPTVCGLIFAGWQGAAVGFGFGFFFALIAAAVSKKYTKAVEHSDVQSMKMEGWSVSSQN